MSAERPSPQDPSRTTASNGESASAERSLFWRHTNDPRPRVPTAWFNRHQLGRVNLPTSNSPADEARAQESSLAAWRQLRDAAMERTFIQDDEMQDLLEQQLNRLYSSQDRFFSSHPRLSSSMNQSALADVDLSASEDTQSSTYQGWRRELTLRRSRLDNLQEQMRRARIMLENAQDAINFVPGSTTSTTTSTSRRENTERALRRLQEASEINESHERTRDASDSWIAQLVAAVERSNPDRVVDHVETIDIQGRIYQIPATQDPENRARALLEVIRRRADDEPFGVAMIDARVVEHELMTLRHQRQMATQFRNNTSTWRNRGRDADLKETIYRIECSIRDLERLRIRANPSIPGPREYDPLPMLDTTAPKKPKDPIEDLANFKSLPYTTWLRPGVTFKGDQYAVPLTPETRLQPIFQILETERGPQISGQKRDPESPEPEPRLTTKSWPVTVTLMSVDWRNLKLTGTMVASDVPQKPIGENEMPSGKDITTYLEGEIIDLKHFSLETTNFNSTSNKDAENWRELHPFRDLDASDAGVKMLSRKWLDEELVGKYVLMRWKEKCFIGRNLSSTNLSIGGFYYVSMERETGHMQALYYDPQSNPYQLLVVGPEAKPAEIWNCDLA